MRRVAAVGALALLAGCGGGSAGGDAKSALRTYVSALAAHDFVRACAAVTPQFARLEANELASQLQRPAPHGGCAAAFAATLGGLPVHKPPAIDLTQVKVSGDRATVTARARGVSGHTVLTRGGDGRWRVSCCVGPQIDRQATATYRVPSASMEPTLKVGAILHVDQRAYRTAPPRRGDIVIAHPAFNFDGGCANPSQGAGHSAPCAAPAAEPDLTQRFVKRVVALPGDRLSLRPDGRVVRNGRVLDEPYIRSCGTSTACHFPRTVAIPRGTYYLLGDNRAESDDSRFWGPVRRGWIVGRVRQNPRR